MRNPEQYAIGMVAAWFVAIVGITTGVIWDNPALAMIGGAGFVFACMTTYVVWSCNIIQQIKAKHDD